MCHFTVLMGISSNIPLNDTWRNGSKEIGWGGIYLEIIWLNMGMMHSWMILSKVVCKCQMTVNCFDATWSAICNQRVMKFHRSWTLNLDSVIWNSTGSGIMTINWSGWLGCPISLRMRQMIFLFCIDKERTEFCLSSWSSNKTQEECENMDWSIQFICWYFWSQTRKEFPTVQLLSIIADFHIGLHLVALHINQEDVQLCPLWVLWLWIVQKL